MGGADVDQPNAYGATPLLMAVTARDINTNVVEELLDAKANPTLVSCGSSPLSAAIKLGNLKVLELFKKAQNEKAVNVGQAPEVAKKGSSTYGKFLILTGRRKPTSKEAQETEIPASRETEAGKSPPQTPRDNNSPDTTTASAPVQAMEGAKTREGDENTFLNACFYGNIDNVRLLINQNANVNQTTKNGATPIIYASELGYNGVVEELIQAGADVNKAREDGASPILFASTNGHHGVVRKLIEAGANANKAMIDGTTPIFLACQSGHKDVVKTLFYLAGADSKCLTEIDFLGNEVIRERVKSLFPLYPGMEELIKRITSDKEIEERDKKLNQDPSPSAGTTRLPARRLQAEEYLAGASYRELPR